MTGIEVEKIKINLNTIVAIVGFLGTFAVLITMWNDARNSQVNTDRWIEQHAALHDAIAKDLVGLHQIDQMGDKATTELGFKVAQNEKALEIMDTRINRITESYGNQFTDLRSSVSAILTNQALQSQSLQRLEASGKLGMTETPREFKK